jgi:glycosyltransferase involved in cell wall biosynthesis
MTTYFDVSDVIRFARGNSRVSGIQRVQMRILQELVCGPQYRDVGVVYFNSKLKTHVVIEPRIVFGGRHDEFDPRRVLCSLGEIEGPQWFPERYQVRRHLRPYDHSKPLRSLVKAGLYAQALLMPRRLIAQGFDDWRRADDWPRSLLTPLRLQQGDQLALLGAFWGESSVVELARAHHANGGRVAVLVHDVIPRVVPQYCGEGLCKTFWSHFERLPDYVNHYLAVSDYTKQDFVRSMGGRVDAASVTVVPLAHEFAQVPRVTDVPAETPAATRPYVLCVGTIEGRKNPDLLLRAWQLLLRRLGPDATPDLVLCGRYGSHLAPFKSLLSLDPLLRAKVRIENTPSDSALVKLYRGALFTVFPSHYEGWGLPVGESAWLGKYCLASEASSVPEVLGELIDYASPNQPAQWCERITELLQDPAQLRARELALRRAPLRTWEQTAHDMLDAIQRPEAALAAHVPAPAWWSHDQAARLGTSHLDAAAA